MKLYQARLLLHCQCIIHACWPSAIPCRELLSCWSCNVYACWPSVFTATNTAASQICLLVECCCKIVACWTVVTQTVSLLIFCHSILNVCWCCASLFAIPDGTVSHYQPCLLVWCLNIGHAFWCGRHYQPFLRYACLYSTTLSDMHAWFIYSDTRVCKVVLY